jgi:hypothetical protein
VVLNWIRWTVRQYPVTNSVLEGWRVGDESYFRICLSIADWALWKMEDTMKLLALLGTFNSSLIRYPK